MQSPFIAIAAYEKKLGIPANYLNCSMYVHLHIQGDSAPEGYSSTGRGPNGAWQKFERGEIGLFSFYAAFSRDLSDTVNGNIWLARITFLVGSLIYSL
jgi:hypothetical protein